MTTKNQTRPSCARVKVKVGLLQKFPKSIKIGVQKVIGEVAGRWITIKYDYIPKYCTTCMIQGYDEGQYFVLHSELYSKKKSKTEEDNNNNEDKGEMGESTENMDKTIQEEKEEQQFEEPRK